MNTGARNALRENDYTFGTIQRSFGLMTSAVEIYDLRESGCDDF